MDLILTSFSVGSHRQSTLPCPFSQMPPFCSDELRTRIGFDYLLLLMFDRVVIDQRAYENAIKPEPHSDDYWYGVGFGFSGEKVKEYSHFLQALNESGRLVIEDFEDVQRELQNENEKLIQSELKDIYPWTSVLYESLVLWNSNLLQSREAAESIDIDSVERYFEKREIHMACHTVGSVNRGFFPHTDLKNWKARVPKESRYYWRQTIGDYLKYVVMNIQISQYFNGVILDWMDFNPFYLRLMEKNTSMVDRVHTNNAGPRKFFEIIFPYFSGLKVNYQNILYAMEDRRIEDFRKKVKETMATDSEFDPRMAIELLHEVVRAEKQSNLMRKITGWSTFPIGFIPVVGGIAQKATEEVANAVVDRKLKKSTSWYYFMNEIVSTDNK